MSTTSPLVASCDLPAIGEASMPARLLHWDGRLDNRRELQAALGVTCRPTTDDRKENGALVLAVYTRWGCEGLGRVIGDWSLVIADPRRQAIVLASDYAGVRPLYYTRDRQRVCWSSRLDALVSATGAEAIDEQYVGAFLTLGGHPTRTPYAEIAAVPAGRAVTLTASGVETRAIWTMPITDVVRYDDEREYDEQLRALFRDAVATRLQAPAPVIAELSGGLDSSSVVCMAQSLITRGDVPATGITTVSYVHEGSLDLPYIREVEAFCGIRGVHVSTHDTPLATADRVGGAAPEVWVPLHQAASGVAREIGATAFLTGQNGDLAMGNWFDDSLQVAAPLRAGRIGRAIRESLAWSKVLRVPMSWILWRALRASLPIGGTLGAQAALGAFAPPHSDETSLPKAFAKAIDACEPGCALSTDWRQAPPERRKYFLALSLMQELRTLQLLEPVRDLDYTHPFAHRPLVDFMLRVPPDVLCRPGEPRRLMRRALGDLWPPRLRARRSKSLFAAPWIEALRPLALGLLEMPQLQVVSRGWIDRQSLTMRLQKLTRGLDCNEPQLRQIILLEYWLRNRSTRDWSAGTWQPA